MMKKWKDSRGETLVEVLAAILIGSLSVTLIFGAIMASTTMDRQAQDMDKSYYDVLSKAERQGSGDELEVAEGAEKPKITVAAIATPEAAPEGGLPLPPAPEAAPGGTAKSVDIDSVTFYGGKGAISYALPDEEGGT